MPLEFLSDAQVAAYGRFDGVPSSSDLERFFVVDDQLRASVALRRGDHNRLGFALQATTVRFLGVFLEDPLDVPWPVVDYLAVQLDVVDASCVKQYMIRTKTRYEHAWEITAADGFRAFDSAEVVGEFRQFLEGRAWALAEGPASLFAEAVGWLRRHRVLLPGISVLMRLVNSVRDDASTRLHRTLVEACEHGDVDLAGRLLATLNVADGFRLSELELWRRSPTRVSGAAMARALHRTTSIIGVGAGTVDCSGVPASRLAALARHGMVSTATALRDLAEPRRTATLLGTVRHLEAVAVDDALDLFEQLMTTRVINPARKVTDQLRVETLPLLEQASRTLALVNAEFMKLLDEADGTGTLDVAATRAALDGITPRHKIADAIATVNQLVPADDPSVDAATRVAVVDRYRTVRPFLAVLSASPVLRSTASGARLLDAVRTLDGLAARKVTRKPMTVDEIDDSLIPPMWRRAIFENPDLVPGVVDRDAYVVCVLEQLHKALRVRDVFAWPSYRWGDPRARLLSGAAWDQARPNIVDGLSLSVEPEPHLRELTAALDASWFQLLERFGQADDSASVQIVPAADGRARLSVERFEALEKPASLLALRKQVQAMLPRVDLPDLLMEVHAWTGFLDAYQHVSGADVRMNDLAQSVAALLVAEACNVGLTPVVSSGNDALRRSRLSHVTQNYVRAETHIAANRHLIAAQSNVPIAQRWGGGLVASVDGLRFVVPVQTIHAGPNPKYFGRQRGLTWLNAINDQVAGIGAKVVPGTPRDSLHILDVILNLDGGPQPEMIATDEASYSDMVFGIFRMLGYRFSPRINDLGDTRYWRATWPGTTRSDYGPLNAIARNNINLKLITTRWADMLRVVGSLVTHQIRAYDLIRMLRRNGNPTPLGRAFEEYGRIAKTLHLLAMVDPIDDHHRRAVNHQTTAQESRHRLARVVCHGRRGQIFQAYREGQEDQLAALGIVVNAIVLWNTRYVNNAIEALTDSPQRPTDSDIRRVSPLGHAHLNVLGRYTFPPATTVTTMRPLRDPDITDS